MVCFSLFRCAGPVNNILIVRKELCFNSRPISQASSRRCGSLLPPALEKYSNPIDEDADVKAIFDLHSTCGQSVNASYMSSHVINNQIKELKVCSVDVLDPLHFRCPFVCACFTIPKHLSYSPTMQSSMIFCIWPLYRSIFSNKVLLLLLKWRWKG